MSPNPFNETFKKQNRSLIPATFKRAFITAVQSQNATADVYFAENPNTVIRSIPLAKHIVPSTIIIGQRCRVDLFDEKNSRDMVIAYVF